MQILDISISKRGASKSFQCTSSYKCALPHKRLHCVQIWTSKSFDKKACFDKFYSNLCFAGQWRALFRDSIAMQSSKYTPIPGPFVHYGFDMCFVHHWLPIFGPFTFHKRANQCHFSISTSKSASHHKGLHICNISICKNRPRIVCSFTFSFEMCLVMQQVALFPQKVVQAPLKNYLQISFAPQWPPLSPTVNSQRSLCQEETSLWRKANGKEKRSRNPEREILWVLKKVRKFQTTVYFHCFVAREKLKS